LGACSLVARAAGEKIILAGRLLPEENTNSFSYIAV
jgi:hypothetical protein